MQCVFKAFQCVNERTVAILRDDEDRTCGPDLGWDLCTSGGTDCEEFTEEKENEVANQLDETCSLR